MAVATETVFGSHVLTMDEFTKTTAALAVGETIKSDQFRVGGHTWHIECCPRREYDGVEVVFVYLWLDLHDGTSKDHDEVKASPKFILLDRDGKAIEETYGGFGCVAKTFSTKTHLHWGFDEVIERKALESHLIIQDDDCCRIRCDVTVITEPPPPPPSDSDLGDILLASEVGRDVYFVVGGVHFSAHSCVLAVRTSTAFMAEVLAGKERAGSRHVRIDDIAPWAFGKLLHFIYTDSLPDVEDEQLGVDDVARALLEVAHRYGMERLKTVCTDVLCSHIYAPTALLLLSLSQGHRNLKLNKACVEYISDMLNGYNMERDKLT